MLGNAANATPLVRLVTLLTASPKATLVDIFLAVARIAVDAHLGNDLACGCRLRMASQTAHLAVCVLKRELGLAVVVEVPQSPRTLVVAARTVDAQRSLVGVVGPMASDALARRFLETMRSVTGVAGGHQVATDQRKARLGMVEAVHAPVDIAVALLAAIAERVVVLVVLLVTSDAGHRSLPELAEVSVTVLTLDLAGGVRVPQGELGPLVVELARDRLPVLFDVALGAAVTQCRLVLVVLFVAVDALAGCLAIERILVTVLAGHLEVGPEQRELGLGMVEAGRLLPIGL